MGTNERARASVSREVDARARGCDGERERERETTRCATTLDARERRVREWMDRYGQTMY
jgi:hypothetical protein|tara:strand:- start:291 stop:467 length:177 start_codon:yes stop_codon:yes gene_type:complete